MKGEGGENLKKKKKDSKFGNQLTMMVVSLSNLLFNLTVVKPVSLTQ